MSTQPILVSAYQCVFPPIQIVPAIGDVVSFEYDDGLQGIARATGLVVAVEDPCWGGSAHVKSGAVTYHVPTECLTRERPGGD